MPCARSYLRWPTFKCKVYSLDFAAQNRSAADAAITIKRPPEGGKTGPPQRRGCRPPAPRGCAPAHFVSRHPCCCLALRELEDFLNQGGGSGGGGQPGNLVQPKAREAAGEACGQGRRPGCPWPERWGRDSAPQFGHVLRRVRREVSKAAPLLGVALHYCFRSLALVVVQPCTFDAKSA